MDGIWPISHSPTRWKTFIFWRPHTAGAIDRRAGCVGRGEDRDGAAHALAEQIERKDGIALAQ